jgi:hypothetical protein
MSASVRSDFTSIAYLLIFSEEAQNVLQIRQLVPKGLFPLRDFSNFLLDLTPE